MTRARTSRLSSTHRSTRGRTSESRSAPTALIGFRSRRVSRLRDPPRQEALAPILSLYIDRLNKRVNQQGKYKCALVCDEFATVRAYSMTTIIATGRSNNIVPIIAVQDLSQLRTQYSRDEADLFLNIAGNLVCGQVGGETARWVSERFPGVVRDIRSTRIKEEPGMEFYRPWSQENFPFVNVAVLSTLNTDAVTKLVQSALSKVNPGLAIAVPQSMDAVVAQALGQARLMMILLGLFAGVALLLAAVGIYGAVAYSVAQRTGEIGVRIALGAQTADVLKLVFGQGMMPVVIGLASGIVAALALGRLLRTQLYHISPHNPTLLFTTAIVLVLVAMIACLLPARRATQVDPIQALRAE